MVLLRQGQEIGDNILAGIIERHESWLVDPKSPEAARADVAGAILRGKDLAGTNFRKACLAAANLIAANLRGIDLADAVLDEAILSGANLNGANLNSASLAGTNLSGADLTGCDLQSADLTMADLSGAKLAGAVFHKTCLSGANLKGASGLNRCIHLGSSIVDDLALKRSGSVPRAFLFGCGFSEDMIAGYAEGTDKHEKGYPCQIIYGEGREENAMGLHRYLSEHGLRVWTGRLDVDPGHPDRAHYDPTHQKILVVTPPRDGEDEWVRILIDDLKEHEEDSGQVVTHLIVTDVSDRDYERDRILSGGQIFHVYSDDPDQWADTSELLEILTKAEALDLAGTKGIKIER